MNNPLVMARKLECEKEEQKLESWHGRGVLVWQLTCCPSVTPRDANKEPGSSVDVSDKIEDDGATYFSAYCPVSMGFFAHDHLLWSCERPQSRPSVRNQGCLLFF